VTLNHKRRSVIVHPVRQIPKVTTGGTRMTKRKSVRQNEKRAQARQRALGALTDMRHGISMSRAARNNGITIRTMKRYVGAALRQDRPGGRIRARKSDRLLRFLQLPGKDGPIDIAARGSKQAKEISKYKAAVNRFLAGDGSALAPWRGKKIAGVELITDKEILKNLAHKDLLPYSLYRSLSGGAA
jgi:hypothetical protein